MRPEFYKTNYIKCKWEGVSVKRQRLKDCSLKTCKYIAYMRKIS